ncbi:tetratricopeptide repeat protein [Naasia aerilata]|nr:hypothetical protein [Naasia aerilata]
MLLRNKASYLANLGRLGSIDLLEEAVELLEEDGASFTRANVLGELSARLMLSGRTREAIATANRAFEEAQHVDSPGRMSVALNIRGTSKVMSGDIESGLADLQRAGELGVGDPSARLRYRVNLSDAFHLTGRFEEAVAVAVEGTENARRRGLERTSGAILMSNTVEPLFALGDWTRANEVLDRALALEPPLGFSAHLRRLKLWWLLWSGDTDAAVESLHRWKRSLSAQLQTELQSGLAFARVAAEISLEAGDLDSAWGYARAALPENSPRLLRTPFPCSSSRPGRWRRSVRAAGTCRMAGRLWWARRCGRFSPTARPGPRPRRMPPSSRRSSPRTTRTAGRRRCTRRRCPASTPICGPMCTCGTPRRWRLAVREGRP